MAGDRPRHEAHETQGIYDAAQGKARPDARLCQSGGLASSADGHHTASDTDALVDAQYAGAKAGLRPLYDQLLAAIQKFGKDVEVSPKKAYVSLRRNKQFALVQPSTATRLDVGMNLKGAKPTGRRTSGSFNAMVSHRVRLSKAAEIDKELLGWLKQAYEASW